MRFKYYLRGCGMGILVATLLLMVAAGTKKEDMRDEDVIARAKELGMVFSEENIPTEENSPETETEQEKPEEGREPSDSRPVTEDSQTKDAQIEDSQIKESQAEDSKEEEGPIRVSVKPGEVCRELAEDLLEKGLITDAEEFRNFMKEYGYDDLLRVGEYELEKGMTYLEIAKTVTKQ